MIGTHRLIDAFIFNNELDILKIRLEEMTSVVDLFILVEGNHDFKNAPKAMEFNLNKERFAKFAHKIVHVKVEDYPNTHDAWAMEAFTRNATQRGLPDDLKADDYVLLSDVDEIVRATAFQNVTEGTDVCNFNLSFRYYKFNCVAIKDGWGAPVMVRAELFTDPQNTRHHNNPLIPWANMYTIQDAGWHLSYMGGVEAIVKKIEMNAHQELNMPQWKSREHIEKALKFGLDLYDRKEHEWEFIPEDGDYPAFVAHNPRKFERYFEPMKRYQFQFVIPFTGNYDRLEWAIASMSRECDKWRLPDGRKNILVVNNSGKEFDVFAMNPNVEPMYDLHEPLEPMLLSQLHNWMVRRAIANGDEFGAWIHDDAAVKANLLKVMFDKYEEVRGTQWGILFGSGGGDVCSFYNPRYFMQTGNWCDPKLFADYFTDLHTIRLMEFHGWPLVKSHDDSDCQLVLHFGSHTIKENSRANAINNLLQGSWRNLYMRIWGGDPGHETITDPYASGVFPRSDK